MEKYIFTFGGNHPLKRYCQPIFASSYDKARDTMCHWYSNKWCFQYSNQQWEDWKTKAENMGVPVEVEIDPIYAKEDVEYGL